ncbi:MAG TPA: hypothetical protein VFA30_10050 [Gaiellaceae bacterium]|nr:hypothetical protein [Gaiellaceae bacterium]
MRLAALAAAVLVLAPAAAASLPRYGTLVPGSSLGGIRIGETERQVRAALGSGFGLCASCPRTTWYYTVKPFDQHGLGVEFTRGRVSAVYTLDEPTGWKGPKGIMLGDVEATVTTNAGPLLVVTCPLYAAWVFDGRHARTVYYIFDGNLWGFGLMQPHADPCR